MPLQVTAQQHTAHRVRYEMDAPAAGREPFCQTARQIIFNELIDRQNGGGVVDIDHIVAGLLQKTLQLPERKSRSPETVE